MTTSLAKMHESALNRFKSVRGQLDRHKETIGTAVMRVVQTAEASAGGAAAAAIDYYLGGQSSSGLPFAEIGPVPAVLGASIGLTLVAVVAGKEEWAAHVGNFAAGMGAAGAYAETIRFLQSYGGAQPVVATG